MGRESDARREARLARAGAWLKDQRTRSGLSQAALAHKLDVSQSQVSMYEKGRHEVDGELARDLARIFGLSELDVWVGLRLPLPKGVRTRSDQQLITELVRRYPDELREALRSQVPVKPTRRAVKRPDVTRPDESEQSPPKAAGDSA
jgi:transcriptional regulator with XRE-family HTH domain